MYQYYRTGDTTVLVMSKLIVMAMTIDELEEQYQISQGFLEEEFTDEHAKGLALLIDSWELLASHLGLSEQQIEAIKVDNNNQQVRRLKVLNKWKQKYACNATYRRLLEVLLSIDRTDLACNVCELVTSQRGTCV